MGHRMFDPITVLVRNGHQVLESEPDPGSTPHLQK